jgi:hypothetical protein
LSRQAKISFNRGDKQVKNLIRWQRNKFCPNAIRAMILAGAAVLLVIPLVYAEKPVSQSMSPEDTVNRLTQFGFEASVPPSVQQAAEDGLDPFLEAISDELMGFYGFSPEYGLSGVSLGQPYRVFTIHPEALFNSGDIEDIRAIITTTQNWLFPLVQRDRIRAILTIDWMDDKWQAVSIGCPRIAGELSRIERDWPDNSGYTRSLVRIYQAASDIMLVVKDARVRVVPFESAAVSLSLLQPVRGVLDTYSPSEIVQKLIPVVERSLTEYER